MEATKPTSDLPEHSKSKSQKHAGARCAFCGYRRSPNSNRRLHRFPIDAHMSQKWAVASGKKWILSASALARYQRYHVCSSHFSNKDYASSIKNRLHADAVPEPCSDAKIAESKQRWMAIKSQLRKALRRGKSGARCWKYDDQMKVLMTSTENDSKQSSSLAEKDSEKGKQDEENDYQLIAEVFTEYDVSLPTDSPTPNVSNLSPVKAMNVIPGVCQSIPCSSSSTTNSVSTPKSSLSKATKTLRQSYEGNKKKYDASSAVGSSPTSNHPSKSTSSIPCSSSSTTNFVSIPKSSLSKATKTLRQSYEGNKNKCDASSAVGSSPTSNHPSKSTSSIPCSSSSTTNSVSIPKSSLSKATKTLRQSYECNKNKCDANSAVGSSPTSNHPSKSTSSPSEAINVLPEDCQSTRHDNSSKAKPSYVLLLSLPAMKASKNESNKCGTSTFAKPFLSLSPNISRLSPKGDTSTVAKKCQPTVNYLRSGFSTVSSLPLPQKMAKLRKPYQCSISSTADLAASNFPHVLRLSRIETTTTKPGQRQPTEYDSNSSVESAIVPRLSKPEMNDNRGNLGESAMELEDVKTLREPYQCNEHDTSSAAKSVASDYLNVLKLSRVKTTNTIPRDCQSMEHDSSSTSNSPPPELNLGESAVDSEAMKTLPEPRERNQYTTTTSSAADSAISDSPSTSTEAKKRETGVSSVAKCTPQRSERELDPVDAFFLTVASSVKKFSAHDQHIVKSQVLNLVNNIEEKYVAQQTNE